MHTYMRNQTSIPFEDATLISASVLDIGKRVSGQSLLIEEIGDYIPGSVMVQDLVGMTNNYMNKQGCEILRHSKEELFTMGPGYFRKFFPEDEVRFLTGKFHQFISERDYNKVFSFFQRVRPDESEEYKWYLTTSRLIPVMSETDIPEVMHISLDVQSLPVAGKHIRNLGHDNSYQLKYYHKFNLLSKREKEIIIAICQGFSSLEISDRLFISIHTVNNHRKNILTKLEISSLAQLIRFAVAFGLVE